MNDVLVLSKNMDPPVEILNIARCIFELPISYFRFCSCFLRGKSMRWLVDKIHIIRSVIFIRQIIGLIQSLFCGMLMLWAIVVLGLLIKRNLYWISTLTSPSPHPRVQLIFVIPVQKLHTDHQLIWDDRLRHNGRDTE